MGAGVEAGGDSLRAASTLRDWRSLRPIPPPAAPSTAMAPVATRNRRRSTAPIDRGPAARHPAVATVRVAPTRRTAKQPMPVAADTAAANQPHAVGSRASRPAAQPPTKPKAANPATAGRRLRRATTPSRGTDQQRSDDDPGDEDRLLAGAEGLDAPANDPTGRLGDEQAGDANTSDGTRSNSPASSSLIPSAAAAAASPASAARPRGAAVMRRGQAAGGSARCR